MKGLKTYFTFLERNKLFTLVNVAGLGVSLMFVLLISDMVTRQLTVDKDLPDADRISVFANEHWAGGHYNLGDRLQSRYPEIEDWCAIKVTNPFVQPDDKPMQVLGASVKKNFFEFFRLPLLEGNREQLLTDDNSVVLTRSSAIRLFGTEHAVGKSLKVLPCNNELFTVTGILEDINNSVIPSDIDIFIPFENMKYINWSCSMECTAMHNAGGSILFFRTSPASDLNKKADDIVAYLKEFFWLYQYDDTFKEARFIPLRDFYFSETPASTHLNQYDFKLVVIFITVGILILLMAVLNYISMSVAQTSYRAKEMATRRLLGSSKPDIFWRMIAESFLLTLVSFIIGFVLAKAAEPAAIELLHAKIDLMGDLNVLTVIIYIAFIVILTLLSGFIPATILSNYNPMDVVKGTFRRKTKSSYLRLLYVVQCGLTVALLTCALFLGVRVRTILHEPLGYTYGNVLVYPSAGEAEDLQRFRDEALRLPFVKNVCMTRGIPAYGGNNLTSNFNVNGKPISVGFQVFEADSAFLSIFHIPVEKDFRLGSASGAYYLNHQACRKLALPEDASSFSNTDGSWTLHIAGLIPDFRVYSVLEDIRPVLLQVLPSGKIGYPWSILVEVDDGDLAGFRKQVDALYSEAIDGIPFESRWYDGLVNESYSDFIRLGKIIVVFTGAALLISLLGLTAMSIYFIAQRKRDMAIRKVFGSSSLGERMRLMRFSLVSILVSLVLAVPLAVFGVVQIDRIVTYESAFPWWVPLAAFVAVTLISLGSVWLISLKATRENPVENLKTE